MATREGEAFETSTELGRHLGGVAESMSEDERVTEGADDRRDAAEARGQEVLAWIQNRPVASVLIAVAIGYLFARVTR